MRVGHQYLRPASQRRTHELSRSKTDCGAPSYHHQAHRSSPKFEKPCTMRPGALTDSDGRSWGPTFVSDSAKRGLLQPLTTDLGTSREDPMTSSLGLRRTTRGSERCINAFCADISPANP